jgi:hypothetical protein
VLLNLVQIRNDVYYFKSSAGSLLLPSNDRPREMYDDRLLSIYPIFPVDKIDKNFVAELLSRGDIGHIHIQLSPKKTTILHFHFHAIEVQTNLEYPDGMPEGYTTSNGTAGFLIYEEPPGMCGLM